MQDGDTRDDESHEYLGDAHWDEALHGLVRVIVREGYATMDNLRNDPVTARFLTDSSWLKTYWRQQFTEDRKDPTFVSDDPDYKLVCFTIPARYDVFAVAFKGWLGCDILTAVNRYLSSERGKVPQRRRKIIRSLAAANGLER